MFAYIVASLKTKWERGYSTCGKWIALFGAQGKLPLLPPVLSAALLLTKYWMNMDFLIDDCSNKMSAVC